MLEERRLREEEERKLQEEQDKKEREERERYEAEERKILDIERQEFEGIRGNITGRIREQLDKTQEVHEVRHMCNAIPILSITYMCNETLYYGHPDHPDLR